MLLFLMKSTKLKKKTTCDQTQILVLIFSYLKVRKSRQQVLMSSILPKKERKNNKKDLRTSKHFFSFFRSFFGRIEEAINCF